MKGSSEILLQPPSCQIRRLRGAIYNMCNHMAIMCTHTQPPWLRFRSSDPWLVSLTLFHTALLWLPGIGAFKRLHSSVHDTGGGNMLILRTYFKARNLRAEDTKRLLRENGKLEATNVSP